MIHGFTAAYMTMRVNVAIKAFRQIMAQLAIGSASLAGTPGAKRQFSGPLLTWL